MQNKRNDDNSMGEELSQARRSSHDTPQEQGSTVWSKQPFVLLSKTISRKSVRPQCAAGKGRSFHDDLHAFSSGGILFVNNGALRKERVSDGPLFANSSKKYEKMPPETDGFWTSFTFKRLACYGTVKGIDSATDPLPLR